MRKKFKYAPNNLGFLRVTIRIKALFLHYFLFLPMKTVPKFTIIHPYKTVGGGDHRFRIAALALFLVFAFTFFLNLIATRDAAAAQSQLPEAIADALLYYASANITSRMSPAEMESVASVLRRCAAPCNLLVFGLTHETLLWNALNHGGRTVFVDEHSFSVTRIEEQHPSIEAYDVRFTTKVRELRDLIENFEREIEEECRPVQNLLFSDCSLAVNDLPNYMYDVAWDVIVIDGPSGYSSESPGRMASIFTAGVMARSRNGGGGTHVFVHEMQRQVESVCTDLFLCRENLVERVDLLGHFLVRKMGGPTNTFGFCSHPSLSTNLI
ncbi:protein IRX15-LIKE-like [Salvia miltiorrhiza]|uniref:protein IRX15-LIKE-like n=1 Tax=Salvia miltiorrhiza TaxID=226208 RepID=UPI0025AC1B79|nr:protein IRX15-LIKE-like [Salvia miltiorrhiza]